jgi:hypothetical protein
MGAISAAPLIEAKGRNRQMVPKWAELALRECKAGFRASDLKQPLGSLLD